MIGKHDLWFLDKIANGSLTIDKQGNMTHNGRRVRGSKIKSTVSLIFKNEENQFCTLSVYRLYYLVHMSPDGTIPKGFNAVKIDENNPAFENNIYLKSTNNGALLEYKKSHGKVPSTAMLNMQSVTEIRRRLQADPSITYQSLTAEFGTSAKNICFAATGVTWKDCPEPPVVGVKNKFKVIKYAKSRRSIIRLLEKGKEPAYIVRQLVSQGSKMSPTHIKFFIRQYKKGLTNEQRLNLIKQAAINIMAKENAQNIAS